MLSLQQGGYMTLAQFAMTFWHDLAAPILAGIITAGLSAGGVTGSKVKTGVRLP
ncbi:toxin Ldr, type I toxin-antitoxin system family protein [Escherichia coli]|nr:toxin Ldr, type I toxin-antitoxin system family protein [Escherichia coli]